jgi:hypothetical protein
MTFAAWMNSVLRYLLPRLEMRPRMDRPPVPLIRLAVEANEVIGLRMMKIISGGPDAMAEMQLMITEKINASAEAGTSLMFGQSPTAVMARVREHVAMQLRGS